MRGMRRTQITAIMRAKCRCRRRRHSLRTTPQTRETQSADMWLGANQRRGRSYFRARERVTANLTCLDREVRYHSGFGLRCNRMVPRGTARDLHGRLRMKFTEAAAGWRVVEAEIVHTRLCCGIACRHHAWIHGLIARRIPCWIYCWIARRIACCHGCWNAGWRLALLLDRMSGPVLDQQSDSTRLGLP